jgi:hypothetical protein
LERGENENGGEPVSHDYEPAVVVHSADCDDAPPTTLVYPARAVADAYPTGRPHRCFHRRTDRAVVEHIEYETHMYVPSTIRPDDATRPLCRVCRGTHGCSPDCA